MHPWSTTVNDVIDHRRINVYSYPAGSIEDESRVTPPPTMPPTVSFPEVPQGLTFFAPAIFNLDCCEPLTFNVGNPVLNSGMGTFARLEPTVIVDPHVEPVARIWFTFTGTTIGASSARATVSCVETEESWEVQLVGTIIERPSAAVALVLDRSNSMNEESGIAPGIKRSDVLRFSAPPCITVLDDEHACMVLTFDHDANVVRGLTQSDAAGRALLTSAIETYTPNPNGWTAIGEAVQFTQNQLNSVMGFTIRAMIVLTDGKENHGPHARLALDDVTVNDHVFAIGLGTPANLSPGTLSALCNDNDGYMLITGSLNQDAFFRLAKYYQQIISGVTNQDIVLDPDGIVNLGEVIRIPFEIADTDITARAVLLTDNPSAVLFGLETPDGEVIDPSMVNPQVLFRMGTAVEMYRVSLPLPLGANTAHIGTWHALIGLGRKNSGGLTHGFGTFNRTARYSLSVHTYSNVRMKALLTQSGNEPGATVFFRATLTEYAQPQLTPSSVRAEILHPDNSTSDLMLARSVNVYEGSFVANQSGVYQVRIIAEGTTRRGRKFTREATRTASVWQGGNQPPPDTHDPSCNWCEIIKCLLNQKSIIELLKRLGIDPSELARCLFEFCNCNEDQERIAKRISEVVPDKESLNTVINMLNQMQSQRRRAR
jgi:von Willebrand factor type A domain